MSTKARIANIVGARPQFIKAATICRTFRDPGQIFRGILVHTGQHFDDNMSEVFFRELEIPKPDFNLGIGGGTYGQNTGRMIERIESVLLDERPDWVVVYGDTDSTLAGAVAACKLHIPVAHVEAGLRSFNRRMPEEINRIVADDLSTILFCPTETAVSNLKKEGFPHLLTKGKRQVMANVGDVMHDAALFYGAKAEEKSRILETLGLESKRFVLATVHRAENTDDAARLKGIMDALTEIGEETPVILPIHPRTRKKLELVAPSLLTPNASGVQYIDPVGYLDMVMLEKNARVIVTDSGGVQKEAYFHGVPCVTVRDETEWVELVEIGANYVAGTETQGILKLFRQAEKKDLSNFSGELKTLYGDGDSAYKIVKILKGADRG